MPNFIGGVGTGFPISPFEFFTQPPPSQPPPIILNWYDDTDHFPQDLFNYFSGIAGLQLAEYSMGDNTELPSPIAVVSNIVLMGYTGYWTSKSLMLQADDSTERITIPTEAFDTDAEQQTDPSRLWAPNQYIASFFTNDDDLSDTGVELITLPITGWDTDAENQFLQPSWYLDLIEERNELPIILIVAYDTDAEQQNQQLGLTGIQTIQIPEVAIGDNNEQPVIPIQAYDTDAEQQFQQPTYLTDRDLSDAGVEILPQLSVASDTILMGYRGYFIPKSLMLQSDDGVEKITIITLLTDFTWDNDTDNQFLQAAWSRDLYTPEREVSDLGVERIIIPINSWQDDAEQQKLNPVSFGSDILADEGVEKITLPAIVATTTWDDINEQSTLLADYFKDHLSDEGIEILPQLFSGTDTILMGYKGYFIPKSLMLQADDSVELITVIVIITDHTWDDINEQLPQAPWYLDQVEERNQLPIIPKMEIDNDADQQRLNPSPFGTDTVMDEEVELITLAPAVPTRGMDTDAENQLSQLPYQLDESVFDAQIEVLPRLSGATDVILIGYQGYSIPRSLMLQAAIEDVEIIIAPARSFDTDAEQQFASPLYQVDRDVTDAGVENIIFSGITSSLTWDNDAEQQFIPVFLACDDQMDSGVEFISLPPFIDIVEIVAGGEDENDN
jgi:hypothetical protein